MLPQPRALHQELLQAQGVLLVVRAASAPPRPPPGQPGVASDYVQATPEVFIALRDDGSVYAFNGKVDLGTGIRTSLAQVAAEELELPLERVQMVLGHTEAVPNQGPTIASATIQISSVPLRRAAAQARAHLIGLAAQAWQVEPSRLTTHDGGVQFAQSDDPRRLTYAELLRGRHDVLTLDLDAPLKPASAHRLLGRSVRRADVPAKATGQLTFVHDVRVPGMRHGRVIRPPYAGRDAGEFVGRSLLSVEEASVATLPGRVEVVVIGDFVGVVADREEQAERAMRALRVAWRPAPPAVDLSDLSIALRRQPAVARTLTEQGDVDGILRSAQVLRRSYVWPYQLHASIGPSCAVADFSDGRVTVWAGTQNPHMLRTDLDRLLALGEGRIEIVRLEAAGCYGRNCADDVCADAALLSRAVGAPVRVQLMRDQEHVWEPKGAAQLMDVAGAIDANGAPLVYDFATRYPSNDAPLLALLLTGAVEAVPRTLQMGDRTAVTPYRFPHLRAVCHDMPPLVRASWLRGVSALPNSFAHDCFIDELARAAGADPVDYRLRHLDDTRAAELLAALAERARWQRRVQGSRGQVGGDGLLRGRGVSYARYVHSKFPGFGAAWSAWVADLELDPATGRIRVTKLFVGQDTGMMVNPAGVRHQLHGNVIQSLSRTLMEQVQFDARGAASREWGAYPILGFKDLPEIDVLLMPRQDEPPMGAGESASVPCAAAIANALFDATGVRFRAPPFTRDVVLAGLQARAAPEPGAKAPVPV